MSVLLIVNTPSNPVSCQRPFLMQVAPNSVSDVLLHYRPGSYQTLEQATVCISSQAAGSYEYTCTGQVRAARLLASSRTSSAEPHCTLH